jgi:hypothetical protein
MQENAILFFNSFFSYLLLMAIIVVVGGLGLFVGVKWRAVKDAKAAAEAAAQADGQEQESQQ